jgi:hypothetical protein
MKLTEELWKMLEEKKCKNGKHLQHLLVNTIL